MAFYGWETWFGGLDVSAAKQLKALEDENSRLKRMTGRRRGSRKRAKRPEWPIESQLASNQRWSLDFVSGQMTDGRRFRILTVIDDCTRECLALAAARLQG